MEHPALRTVALPVLLPAHRRARQDAVIGHGLHSVRASGAIEIDARLLWPVRSIPIPRGNLRLLVREYVEHYNQLLQRAPPPARSPTHVRRRECVGGDSPSSTIATQREGRPIICTLRDHVQAGRAAQIAAPPTSEHDDRHAGIRRVEAERARQRPALLHESSLARTMPTDRILTCRCDTTLVGRGRSSDSRSHGDITQSCGSGA